MHECASVSFQVGGQEVRSLELGASHQAVQQKEEEEEEGQGL